MEKQNLKSFQKQSAIEFVSWLKKNNGNKSHEGKTIEELFDIFYIEREEVIKRISLPRDRFFSFINNMNPYIERK